mgnify:FL=1
MNQPDVIAAFREERDRLLFIYRAARAVRDADQDSGTDEALRLDEALAWVENYWDRIAEGEAPWRPDQKTAE